MNTFINKAIAAINVIVLESKAVHKHGGLCHTKRHDGILIGYSDELAQNVYGPDSGKSVSFLELQNVFSGVHPNNHREKTINYTLVIHHYISRNKNAKLKSSQYEAAIFLTNYLQNTIGIVDGLNIFEDVSLKSGILPETVSPICEYSQITINISLINNKCNTLPFKLDDLCC
jgi:hypothetical protein